MIKEDSVKLACRKKDTSGAQRTFVARAMLEIAMTVAAEAKASPT